MPRRERQKRTCIVSPDRHVVGAFEHTYFRPVSRVDGLEAYLRFGRHAPRQRWRPNHMLDEQFLAGLGDPLPGHLIARAPSAPRYRPPPSAALISCSPTQQVAYDGAQQSWVLGGGEVPLAR